MCSPAAALAGSESSDSPDSSSGALPPALAWPVLGCRDQERELDLERVLEPEPDCVDAVWPCELERDRLLEQ